MSFRKEALINDLSQHQQNDPWAKYGAQNCFCTPYKVPNEANLKNKETNYQYLEWKISKDPTDIKTMGLNQRWLSPRNIWQCLETLMVVNNWGVSVDRGQGCGQTYKAQASPSPQVSAPSINSTEVENF